MYSRLRKLRGGLLIIVLLHLKQVLKAIILFLSLKSRSLRFLAYFSLKVGFVFASSEGRAYSLNAREVAPAATNPEEFTNDRSSLETGKTIGYLKTLTLFTVILKNTYGGSLHPKSFLKT